MGTGDFPVLFLQLQACNYLKTESYKVIPFPPGWGWGASQKNNHMNRVLSPRVESLKNQKIENFKIFNKLNTIP